MTALLNLQPVVKVIAGPFSPDPRCDIASITYGSSGLILAVQSGRTNVEVVFPSLWGFRVLDELDLTEFWAHCSQRTGWLFEVTDGGWKALELQRAHFVSGRLYENLREYLVISLNECVSVLSQEEPQLRTTQN